MKNLICILAYGAQWNRMTLLVSAQMERWTRNCIFRSVSESNLLQIIICPSLFVVLYIFDMMKPGKYQISLGKNFFPFIGGFRQHNRADTTGQVYNIVAFSQRFLILAARIIDHIFNSKCLGIAGKIFGKSNAYQCQPFTVLTGIIMDYRTAGAVDVLRKSMRSRRLRTDDGLRIDPDAGTEKRICDKSTSACFFTADESGENTAVNQQTRDHIAVAAGGPDRKGSFLNPVNTCTDP